MKCRIKIGCEEAGSFFERGDLTEVKDYSEIIDLF